ncbi:MAG: hypothetical protein GX892_00315 [Thermoanaerobacteraceae bacterium]|jgi:RNase P subunit RPR2|nr:hypothetical protein [Tissierellia bacterium]NLZ51611.1 hypothetical protein [Thermoanaerobacteraceae bacterium]
MKKFFKWFLILLPLLIIAPSGIETFSIIGLVYVSLISLTWLLLRGFKKQKLSPEDIIRRDEVRRVVEQQKREDAKPVVCPKCYSPSITSNEKGFGVGKAVVGVGLFGLPGVLAGNIGRKKLRVTCLSCGHAWRI